MIGTFTNNLDLEMKTKHDKLLLVYSSIKSWISLHLFQKKFDWLILSMWHSSIMMKCLLKIKTNEKHCFEMEICLLGCFILAFFYFSQFALWLQFSSQLNDLLSRIFATPFFPSGSKPHLGKWPTDDIMGTKCHKKGWLAEAGWPLVLLANPKQTW